MGNFVGPLVAVLYLMLTWNFPYMAIIVMLFGIVIIFVEKHCKQRDVETQRSKDHRIAM